MATGPVLCAGTPGLIFGGGCTLRVTSSFCIARFAKFTQGTQGGMIKFTLRPLRFLASFAIHLSFVSQGSQSLRKERKGEMIKFTLRPLRFLASFAIHLSFVSQGSQSLCKERKGEMIKFTLRPLRFLASFAIHLSFVSQGLQSLRKGCKGKTIKAIGAARERLLAEPPLSIVN